MDAALAALEGDLRSEAGAAFAALEPVRALSGGSPIRGGERFSLGGWQAVLGDSGALVSLQDQRGREWAAGQGIGAYSYQTFSHEDYVRYHQDYNRNMQLNSPWVTPDFGKPGMQYAEPRPRRAFFEPHLTRAVRSSSGGGDTLEVELRAGDDCPRGGPPLLVMRYNAPAGGGLAVSLDWFDKEATRLPEALWISFQFNLALPHRWRFVKLGLPVNPLDVVNRGNRSYHAIEEARYQAYDGALALTPLDTPLAALGERKMLRFDNCFENPAGGVHCNLFNNIWGTNFPLWLEGAGRSRFILSFESP